MVMLFSLFALTTAKVVTTFGSGDGTVWETVNDPVMGGVSQSSFFQGESSGIWKGKVDGAVLMMRGREGGWMLVSGERGWCQILRNIFFRRDFPDFFNN